ncbi:hypothetical protein KEM55_005138 [Ascosphaera atra]|nr:hypothetical protein KEM55_005138 [Ascosphaera atra]
MATPSVDVRQFIAFPPPQILNSPNPQVPALFIYLLNMFSKAIIAQLIAEAGIQPKTAEPLGVFAAQIFSVPDFNYQGVPMIDILLAKYHVVCPVLFGFYGPENTADGKDAIGWWRDDRSAGGPFVPVQNHEERMIGLAAGYAALTLRNFSKAKRANPLPNRHFWTAIAYILNTPPAEVQETHLFVLSSLLTNSAARVVGFWGDLGLALLHRAIVDFPASLSKSSPGKSAVEVLRITYANEKGPSRMTSPPWLSEGNIPEKEAFWTNVRNEETARLDQLVRAD